MNAKSVLLAISAIVLMVGSGALLTWAINDLYYTSSALVVIPLALLSVFTYILGASLLGQSIRKENTYQRHGGLSSGIIFALLLIAGGTLMLCFNTGILNPIWKGFFLSWPMLLFIVGSINICRLRIILGIICAATGKFFLMEKAMIIYPDNFVYEQFISTYWPALIIIFGILIFLCIIIRPGRYKRKRHKGNWKENYMPGENENNDGKINYQFTFSGTEQVILDPVFRGGNIDLTFGGMELDLRRTSLAEGETFLYINAIFGGVEITAPDNWDIEIRSETIVGGVTDSRVKNIDKDHTKKLIIISKCTFGGIEIK